MGWQRLEHLMGAVHEPWPVPDDFLAGPRKHADLDAVRDQRRSEIHRWFIKTAALDTAGLMVGDILAWKLAYPDREVARWRETALRSVGAAMRTQVFMAAIEAWLWRPAELEQELEALLEAKLGDARRLLSSGFTSLAEASRVLGAVEVTCSEIVPDRVWAFVQPRLTWTAAEGVTAPIGVLSEGLDITDPVCGMGLSRDLTVERFTWQRETYFFCTKECRDRFARSPSACLSSRS